MNHRKAGAQSAAAAAPPRLIGLLYGGKGWSLLFNPTNGDRISPWEQRQSTTHRRSCASVRHWMRCLVMHKAAISCTKLPPRTSQRRLYKVTEATCCCSIRWRRHCGRLRRVEISFNMTATTGNVGNVAGIDVAVILLYFIIVMAFGLWVGYWPHVTFDFIWTSTCSTSIYYGTLPKHDGVLLYTCTDIYACQYRNVSTFLENNTGKIRYV